MPVIEVDEEEFKTLGRIRETVAKIAKDPEGKLLLQRAHKKVDPTAVTPDLDETEKRTALNSKMESGRKALRDAGWTKEGIEGVEKLMEEKGILDHEIAAAYIEKQNPPQEIMSPRAFGGFNFVEQPKEEDQFLKALLDSKGDDDNAVLKAAVEAVGDIRHGARR